MERREALAILRRAKGDLTRLGARRVAVFGSTARREAGPDSDVDVLVDIDPAADLGVYEYAALVRHLTELFPVPVHVANRASLKPHVRPSAERDAVYAF